MIAGRLSLRAAIEALERLEKVLFTIGFEAAIDQILELPGKLVVTGMGKAGLMGQKISATLRSTGQPSIFLDPAQALHGDMGMLADGDGLLALSNSGETTEVVEVARFCQRGRDIPVIVISRSLTGPLADLADHVLAYPLVPEGCPIGLAPMASTTMMVAIGDAMASQLMAARGFTRENFHEFHHGGYLGRVIAGQ